MARRALPLAAYSVLRTTDVDEARTSVGAMLAPHRLRPVESAGFAVHHNAARLGRLSMHYIDYGTAVQVEVDRMSIPLVDIPLAGEITVEVGDRSTKAGLGSALVTTSEGAQRRYFSAGNPRLMVGFEASLFQERVELAKRVGMRLPRPSPFRLDFSHGKGRSWRRMLEAMVADLEYGRGLVTEPLVVGSWEVALTDGLIATLTDSRDGTIATTPRENLVRRAARLIDDHCAEPLGTADIAEAVGTSVRGLQSGFKMYLDTTPMAYLRHARLRRVREALLDGSSQSVTDAAARSGITHLGRLAGDYRSAFGESPQETLRRFG